MPVLVPDVLPSVSDKGESPWNDFSIGTVQNLIPQTTSNEQFLNRGWVQIYLTGQVVALEMAITMPNDTTIRVTFSEPADNTASLTNLSFWSLTTTSGVNADILSIQKDEETLDVNYIDITISRPLTIIEYTLTVDEDKISANNEEKYIVAPNNSKEFIPSTEQPYVARVIALDEKTIELEFSADMDGTQELFDRYSYSVNNNITIRKVERISSRKMLLYLNEDMIPNLLYEVTVAG